MLRQILAPRTGIAAHDITHAIRVAAELVRASFEQHQRQCRINNAHVAAVVEFND